MKYTEATEKDDTKWSLSEFIALRGSFSIIQEAISGCWCGRFNNKGAWTHVHIEKKVRGTAIPYILSHQDEYEVITTLKEYCLHKRGDIIDYSTIAADLDPSVNQEESYYTAHDYYMNNPDIFLGEVM